METPVTIMFSNSGKLEEAETSSLTARRVLPAMGSCGRNILEVAARRVCWRVCLSFIQRFFS